MTDRNDFLQNYGVVVARAWEDESYLAKLQADPKATLAEAGIETIDGATINIDIRALDPEASPDAQLDRWQTGHETGAYVLVIPERPDGFDIDELALSDEMLEMVAGGAGCCCCCCPCCCCWGGDGDSGSGGDGGTVTNQVAPDAQ